ncbi:hypothetical protein DSTSK_29290 [Desulforhabdus sp. TSK]|nr:hypothetical protein DSTSK_29290 [Desulforhabdus sp. TSK]
MPEWRLRGCLKIHLLGSQTGFDCPQGGNFQTASEMCHDLVLDGRAFFSQAKLRRFGLYVQQDF